MTKPGKPSSEQEEHFTEMRLNFIIDHWQDFAAVDIVAVVFLLVYDYSFLVKLGMYS